MDRLRILDREHFDAYVYLVGDTGVNMSNKELTEVCEQLLGLCRVQEIAINTLVDVGLTEEQRAEFRSRLVCECMRQNIDEVTGLPK